MARVKVKHGAVWYRDTTADGQPTQRTAFRSMVVEMSDSEAQRLLGLGAVVPHDYELERTGRLTPLPNSASDEELKSWASVASNADIEKACESNPAMADRIRAAREHVERALVAQNEHMGGAPASGDVKFSAEDLDTVVAGTVSDISRFLSEHPDTAQAVLDAEGRRAAAANENVRKGVEEAAAAAAAHTAN